MSYAPGFAPDARSQWQAMESLFQEVVLDILDQLALHPPAKSEHIADAVIEDDSLRHVIFVHALVDHENSTITAVGVGHVTQPKRP